MKLSLGYRLTRTNGTVLAGVATFLLLSTGAGLMAPDKAPTAPDKAPQITLNEDEPGWNCLTMGNRLCGPTWTMVTQELGDALSEGSDTDRDWESCRVNEGDTTYIVCPDGFTQTS